jgi:dTDP-glucose pyrophosphorylase
MFDNKYKKFLINDKSLTKIAIKKIHLLGGNSLIVVDNNNKLKGILGYKDLRKSLINKNILNKDISKIYNKNPKYVLKKDIYKNFNKIFEIVKKIKILPVIDGSSGIVIDLLDYKKMEKFRKSSFNNSVMDVVIMAGGKGTRLKPYTEILPKPLLPINGKPVLKHIIDKFNAYHCKKFFITLNFKSGIIKSYLKDFKDIFSFKIITEKIPLGTAGALYLLKKKIKNDFFLTNCDTIISANYSEILNHHRSKKNDITIVVVNKKFKIPYGVCFDNNKKFFMKEKPVLKYNVNTGFYVISPRCLDHLKKLSYLDFNQFLHQCENNEKKIGLFKIKNNHWIDVGQMESYQKNLVNNLI